MLLPELFYTPIDKSSTTQANQKGNNEKTGWIRFHRNDSLVSQVGNGDGAESYGHPKALLDWPDQR